MSARGLAIAAVAAALSQGGCRSETVGGPCTDDRECFPSQQCVQSVCVEKAQVCTVNQPCPTGQSCCGGICTTNTCCLSDVECPGGFCDAGTCITGARPSCSELMPCATGRCLFSAGRCVECVYADDCAATDFVCSPDHTCIPQGAGCTPQGCALLGKICAPEDGECRNCISDAECGDRVCVAGTCSDCMNNTQCGPGRDCGATGLCETQQGSQCTRDEDCGEQVCKLVMSVMQCEPCVTTPECSSIPGRTCVMGRCIADNPECMNDSDCTLYPDEICQGQLCVAGCDPLDPMACAMGQSCSPSTGRCVVVSTGTGVLGDSCTAHDDCQSGICWSLVDNMSMPIALCSQSCMRHVDCPANAVCFELGEGNFCMPLSLLFPMGAPPLSDPPGTACNTTYEDLDCATSYCGTDGTGGGNVCLEMCGRDSDCAGVGGTVCRPGYALGDDADMNGLTPLETTGFTQICHAPIGAQLPGSVCDTDGFTDANDHDKCDHGYCAYTPNLIDDGRCTLPCCTPADCTGGAGSICKPIQITDGIGDGFWTGLPEPRAFQKICVPKEYQGGKVIGEPCAGDSECKSEICVAGPLGVRRCTQTCCTSSDCAAYDWAQGCRNPFDSIHITADANYSAIIDSLGRDIVSAAGSGRAPALTNLCMPK